MNTTHTLHNSARERLAEQLRRLAQQRQRELSQSERALLAQVARELEAAASDRETYLRVTGELRDIALL